MNYLLLKESHVPLNNPSILPKGGKKLHLAMRTNIRHFMSLKEQKMSLTTNYWKLETHLIFKNILSKRCRLNPWSSVAYRLIILSSVSEMAYSTGENVLPAASTIGLLCTIVYSFLFGLESCTRDLNQIFKVPLRKQALSATRVKLNNLSLGSYDQGQLLALNLLWTSLT